MTFNDLCTWENEVYCKMDESNIKIMKEILKKIKPFYQKELNEKYDGNIVDYFFRIYFNQKKNNNQKKFDNYLEQFNFNYIASIRNGIYYLLGREDELEDCDIDYSLWPGISNATIDDNKYILDTKVGKIEVYKASEFYKNTSSAYIFERDLMQRCYIRTYDFVKENLRDFQAVLSYTPFFFGNCGSYHAYALGNSTIVDIAANALYDSLDTGNKILKGNIIKKLTYDEIEDEFEKIEKEIPELLDDDYNKLYILTLYYDYKQQKGWKL